MNGSKQGFPDVQEMVLQVAYDLYRYFGIEGETPSTLFAVGRGHRSPPYKRQKSKTRAATAYIVQRVLGLSTEELAEQLNKAPGTINNYSVVACGYMRNDQAFKAKVESLIKAFDSAIR